MQFHQPTCETIAVFQGSKNRQFIEKIDQLSEQQNMEILYRFMIANSSNHQVKDIQEKDVQEFRLQLKSNNAYCFKFLQTIISQIEPNIILKSFQDERINLLLRRLGFMKCTTSRSKQQILGNSTSFIQTIKLLTFLALKAEQFQSLRLITEKKQEQQIMRTSKDTWIQQLQQLGLLAYSKKLTQDDQKHYNKYFNDQKQKLSNQKEELQNQKNTILIQGGKIQNQLDSFRQGYLLMDNLYKQKQLYQEQIDTIQDETLQCSEEQNNYLCECDNLQQEIRTKTQIKDKLEQEFIQQKKKYPNIHQMAEEQSNLLQQINLISQNCDNNEEQLKSKQLKLIEQQRNIQQRVVQINTLDPLIQLNSLLFTTIVEQNEVYILYQDNKINISECCGTDANEKLINLLIQPIINLRQNIQYNQVQLNYEVDQYKKEKIKAETIEQEKLGEIQRLKNKADDISHDLQKLRDKIEIIGERLQNLLYRKNASQKLKRIILNIHHQQTLCFQEINSIQRTQIVLNKKFQQLLKLYKDLVTVQSSSLLHQEQEHKKLIKWNSEQIQFMISQIQ